MQSGYEIKCVSRFFIASVGREQGWQYRQLRRPEHPRIAHKVARKIEHCRHECHSKRLSGSADKRGYTPSAAASVRGRTLVSPSCSALETDQIQPRIKPVWCQWRGPDDKRVDTHADSKQLFRKYEPRECNSGSSDASAPNTLKRSTEYERAE